MIWSPYKLGKTLGETGSEEGIIIADEEYNGGIRVTLEKECHASPYAITCGIYNHLVHTVFLGSEDVARRTYDEIKKELVRIYDMIPDADDPNEDNRREERYKTVHAFVERYW